MLEKEISGTKELITFCRSLNSTSFKGKKTTNYRYDIIIKLCVFIGSLILFKKLLSVSLTVFFGHIIFNVYSIFSGLFY